VAPEQQAVWIIYPVEEGRKLPKSNISRSTGGTHIDCGCMNITRKAYPLAEIEHIAEKNPNR
jgi:hypothetical protein